LEIAVEPSDEALLESFRQTQDPTYFKSLVRRYQNRIYNTGYRMLGIAEEAEEVVQETCMKVLQNFDKFRRQSTFAAWIFRIAHNACLDLLRAKRRRNLFHMLSFDPQSSPDDDDAGDGSPAISQATDPGLDPAQELDLTEQGEIIAASLASLPEQQRAVVVLHDIEGFSYQEISEIIGANLGTIRSRLHYGRTKLKELLEPYFCARGMTPAPR
jgi:RNA polymerase sigma factor (sigma-70 family)